MPDVQRTRAALIALFATNTTGDISAQDLRDFLVTVMEPEFANPGDFFSQPKPANLTSDRTYRGWMDYSQVILSDCSMGELLYLAGSCTWGIARQSASTCMPVAGMACASYLAAESQAIILREGVIGISQWSATLAGSIGRPVYMASAAVGSINITTIKPTAYPTVIGFVEPAEIGSTGTLGKFRFRPDWAVTGV